MYRQILVMLVALGVMSLQACTAPPKAVAAPPKPVARPAVPNNQIDYYTTPAGADIQPYVVEASKEPQLNEQEAWRLLRTRVKYVFVIYQENRSFDSYFGTFPGADGLFSRPAAQTSGFYQELINRDGSLTTIHPFRIGPGQFAADTDDIDHSHRRIVDKMDIVNGQPHMDHFALVEERKHSPRGNPSLKAKQFGELAMAHEDGDTIPLLWRYADRFVLCDHIFQLMTGPSTLGNLSIIAAQTGQTQWMLHPEQASLPGRTNGVPVLNDDDPLWGSILDRFGKKTPENPRERASATSVQENLTFATLPLSLQGKEVKQTTAHDLDADDDLEDVRQDVDAINKAGKQKIGFGWYQEGYDGKKHDDDDDDGDDAEANHAKAGHPAATRPAVADPVDAEGRHASYVTHHNGPQYFGYIANNPRMRQDLHGLRSFYTDLQKGNLPKDGGLFYIKGGYQNQMGLKPANPDARVQRNFIGDDDHPGYSDAQISEASVARSINRIAASPYWNQCAIIVTWDDSEGDYDHIPPPIRSFGPDGLPLTDGPRVPLLVISPWSRVHHVTHAPGNHASVVKFVDHLFGLIPLAELPDELAGRQIGKEKYHQNDLGPADALTPDVTDLLDAFDPARLAGKAAPLPKEYVMVPEALVRILPQTSGYGCKDMGIVPVDRLLGIKNEIPTDFNPRPQTTPSK